MLLLLVVLAREMTGMGTRLFTMVPPRKTAAADTNSRALWGGPCSILVSVLAFHVPIRLIPGAAFPPKGQTLQACLVSSDWLCKDYPTKNKSLELGTSPASDINCPQGHLL